MTSHKCVHSLSLIFLIALSKSFATDLPSGNAVIQKSGIRIETTSRLAGAVHSLTWNGKEFIDSHDHGRQLQSAINLDFDGTRMYGETYHPTEAGSRNDGAGQTSTSRLLHMVTTADSLQTTTQMAFWLAPDQKSSGHPAKNKTLLSNHLLTKRIQIGYKDMPRVITYDATFSIPVDESNQYAQFEVVTGYMPPEFEDFWGFNPQDGKLKRLSDGPGEQKLPVILATKSGCHAMGCITPNKTEGKGWTGPGYGRFRFVPQKVVKWNTVFRLRIKAPKYVPSGNYSFRTFVVVGDLESVRRDIMQLLKEEPIPLQ